MSRRVQSLQLCSRFIIRSFLQIGINEVFDRMREFIPNKFAMLARGMLQCRLRRTQVASNHRIPVAETRIDMSGHVECMRITWRE